ncbi:MAG: hypothetical protein KA155_07405 [Alphaproteobacteria bacterium]|jgi:hypothetical protein|nr:hypothetical protein [Alphaproteobacteria bacterium]
MNFAELTYEDIDQHVMEQLVFEEDSMSPILRGHILIEKILETLLSNHMLNAETFFKTRRSFDLKLDIAFSLDLINKKYYSAFKGINKIRNNFAHKHNFVLGFEELNSLKFDWAEIQHEAFAAACTKGPGEAAKIATIFLCWKAIRLIKEPQDGND